MNEGLNCLQIEYHPYVYAADLPLMAYMKKHDIIPTSFGGLSPIVRIKDGPLDPILAQIAKRLSSAAGEAVTAGQVLQLWLRKHNIPCVSYVF